jgi:hypothetical protein
MSKTSLTRRAALAGAPAIAVAVAGGTALAAAPDPIFAAIAKYKAAVNARLVVDDHLRREDIDDDDRDDIDAEFDALGEMLDKTPTTVAGVVALLEVLGSDPYREGSYSSAAWAYHSASGFKCRVDRQMLEMAAVLRTMGGGQS